MPFSPPIDFLLFDILSRYHTRAFQASTRDGLIAAALLEIYQEASKKPDAMLRTRTVKV